ncbi:MAG: hypothetical protein QOI66_2037 [Myxococcales bacterium]|nr:hypothetical protein [Myxococcales bacterium]
MNNERRLWVSFFIYCAAALLGCGSDGGAAGSATCDSFVPCGGTLTGTWHLAKTCATPAGMMAAADELKFCPQGTASIDTYNFAGTGTFDGQGAVKYDLLIDFSATMTFPASCLTAGQTCGSVQQQLRAGDGVTTASCQMTSTGCSCSVAVKSPVRQEHSVVTSGTTVTETDPTDGSMETSQYCVDGNTLRVKSDKDGEIDVWTH